MFKVNNKDTRTTPFEQVNSGGVTYFFTFIYIKNYTFKTVEATHLKPSTIKKASENFKLKMMSSS